MAHDEFTPERPTASPTPAPPPAPDDDAPRRRGRFDVWSLRSGLFVVGCALGGGGAGWVLAAFVLSGYLLRDAFSPAAYRAVTGCCAVALAAVVGYAGFNQVRRTVGRGWRVRDMPLPIGGPRDGHICLQPMPAAPVLLTPRRPAERFVSLAGRIQTVALSPDGRRALTAGASGVVFLWDVSTGTGVRELPSFPTGILCVAFSPDGRLAVASGLRAEFSLLGCRNGLHVWDAESGELLRELEFADHAPVAVRFFADSRGVLIAGGSCLRVWDLDGPRPLGLVPLAQGVIPFGTGDAKGVSVSADERLALVPLSGSQDMRLYDLDTGRMTRAFKAAPQGIAPTNSAEIACAAIAPDGLRAVSGSFDGLARVWNLYTGQETLRFRGHRDGFGWRGIVGVAWLDDRRVLSVSENGLLCVWDATTGDELRRHYHGKGVTCLATTPDGRLAITGDWHGVAGVWEVG